MIRRRRIRSRESSVSGCNIFRIRNRLRRMKAAAVLKDDWF
ncbi:hypothetical protein [Paenibacillus sediminis]|uniref:Uncharacterized protein n=1 Tax=Paenibacillus sediminis TaxID=664909 RepID=A0ABS4H750_9BACL|nr:hypothetical protein [Paenibacillus sediminis]MBP1937885.1 hypothetical protein [Paenibacillus sediminis]